MFKELVDEEKNREILSILLYDNITKKNIIWASDNYQEYGKGFKFADEITIDKITGVYSNIIKPRSQKSANERIKRIKSRAEVFTPAWIYNEQNNLVDDEWFGKKNTFNEANKKKWITNKNKIKFPNDKTWQDYIKSLRMEISCGEAPYLVSRYDTVTGKSIKIIDRIGLLDRKLRILSENVDLKEEWIKWSIEAIKSIYGYDLQGDNILLARGNILDTYIDYYQDKFNNKPSFTLLKQVAEIISWNIWQMDGLKLAIPSSCKKGRQKYCQIMNWEKNKIIKFYTLIKK